MRFLRTWVVSLKHADAIALRMGGAFFGDNWTEEGRMRADMSLYEVVGDEGVAL